MDVKIQEACNLLEEAKAEIQAELDTLNETLEELRGFEAASIKEKESPDKGIVVKMSTSSSPRLTKWLNCMFQDPHKEWSVADLAAELDVPKKNIRMAPLEKEGLVTCTRQEQVGSGRPRKFYKLTELAIEQLNKN